MVISLDFELMWGVRDHAAAEDCRQSMLGVWDVVPALLELFAEKGAAATWATVGLLFHESADDAMANAPAVRPAYARPHLSPYPELAAFTADPRLYFCPDLIRAVQRTPRQEIATHTFSHFCCLEVGASDEAFSADLEAAARAADRLGVELRSLVFPRNQYASRHVEAAARHGIVAFRGNPRGWMYAPAPHGGQTWRRRAARLIDAHLPVTRPVGALRRETPTNVRATRFYRASGGSRDWRHRQHVRRISDEMRAVADEDGVYHLWFHPHNLGATLRPNLRSLGELLDRACELGFEHATMGEAAVHG